MSAADHTSKYQFHLHHGTGGRIRYLNAYKGDYRVGHMNVYPSKDYTHTEGEDYDEVATVGGMSVAPEHRHIVPTMIGIMHNRMEDEGMKLVPSTSLSEHSSRIVQKLQGRGLVTEDRESGQSNDIGFGGPVRVPPESRQGHRLYTEEVAHGRSFMRQKLRETRRERQ